MPQADTIRTNPHPDAVQRLEHDKAESETEGLQRDLDGIPLVTQDSEKRLNKKQLLDYRDHREALLSWLLGFGKDPKRAAGYGGATVMGAGINLAQSPPASSDYGSPEE